LSIQVDLNDWNAETLRLTLFAKAAIEVAGISWWESVVGEPPEAHNLRPREGRLEESGRIFDGKCNLTLQCEAQRIDWLLTPVIVADQELTEFPSFATFPDALELFQSLLVPWLVHAPPSKRLAFGCVLTHPAEDRTAGYRWIANLLPSVTLDPERSFDFNYAINRPRRTRTNIEDLFLNRLSRWSVAKLRSIHLQLPHGAKTLAAPELFACRLELDINTVPEFSGEFSANDFKSVTNELVELGTEIASTGDLP
jgi:hypothetical protein